MKRVIVTGATGFIGRHALAPLIDRDFDVHAVSTRARAGDTPAVTWHHANLLNPSDVARLIDAVRPTHLLHFAWFAVPGQFWTSPENLRWVQASLALLQAFEGAGGERFVGAGSCAEYGVSDADCDERHTVLEPSTLYGTCKHAFHIVAEQFAETRLSAAWGRIFHLYGPDEHPDRLVPSVIGALLDGRPARCTAGTQVRDFLDVQDVAAAFVSLLDSPVSGPVNIASGTPVSVADVVTRIGRYLNRESMIELGARAIPAHDPPRLTASVSRLRDEVGWSPSITLDRGLSETIDWWRSHRRVT